MVLKLICQGMWVTWVRAIWFSEKVVIGSQRPGNFLLASVFLLELKKLLTAQPRISTTINNHSHPPSLPRAYLLTKLQRVGRIKSGQDEDRGGGFCHNEGQRYWWEDQGGWNQKGGEGAGWILLFSTHRFCPSHFSNVLVSSCLLRGVNMVNSCWGLLRNSHTRFDNFVLLVCLSTL